MSQHVIPSTLIVNGPPAELERVPLVQNQRSIG